MKNTLLLALFVFSLSGCGRIVWTNEIAAAEEGCKHAQGVEYLKIQDFRVTAYCRDGQTKFIQQR